VSNEHIVADAKLPLHAKDRLLQPIVRGGHRLGHVLWRRGSLPRRAASSQLTRGFAKRISGTERDLYWSSRDGLGREDLLEAMLHEAQRVGWPSQCGDGWVDWDVRLMCDRWHDVLVRTATEELGGAKRFTRARATAQPTWLAKAAAGMGLLSAAAAWAGGQVWAIAAAIIFSLVLARFLHSRRKCLQASATLLARAAIRVPLEPVAVSGAPQSDRENLPLPEPMPPVEREVEVAW
jgi:hypothetical protein